MNRQILFLVFLEYFLATITLVFAQSEGVKIFNITLSRWEKIEDYQCTFTYTEIKEGKETKDEYNLWFKKDNFRKLEGIGGENKGTIVVYNPQEDKDKVRVKRGFLPLTLKKDDERLTGFFVVDWGADLSHLKLYLKNGNIKFIKKEKVFGRNTNVLEFTPKKKTDYTKEIVWLDAEEHILVQIERYREGKFFSRKVYSQISVNSNLSGDDFKL